MGAGGAQVFQPGGKVTGGLLWKAKELDQGDAAFCCMCAASAARQQQQSAPPENCSAADRCCDGTGPCCLAAYPQHMLQNWVICLCDSMLNSTATVNALYVRGYLVKHALLHIGCHDGVDGHNRGPHAAAPPQQVPEMLLRLRPFSLCNNTINLIANWMTLIYCLIPQSMPFKGAGGNKLDVQHAKLSALLLPRAARHGQMQVG